MLKYRDNISGNCLLLGNKIHDGGVVQCTKSNRNISLGHYERLWTALGPAPWAISFPLSGSWPWAVRKPSKCPHLRLLIIIA